MLYKITLFSCVACCVFVSFGATSAPRSGNYGDLPLYFEENHGQAPTGVQYSARGNDFALELSAEGAALELSRGANHSLIRIGLRNSRSAQSIEPEQLSTAKTNYFIGADPTQWKTGVPNYLKVRYSQVYPGVDVVYYGNHRRLEYDFVVAPHAAIRPIELEFTGAHGVSIDGGGNLVIATASGELTQHVPAIYQEVAGQRVTRKGHYVLRGFNRVSFAIGAFDRSLPLVIDPVLSYSSYLGGSGSDDTINGIAVDGAGSAYLVGTTSSQDFPTTRGAYQTAPPSVYGSTAFVTRLNPAGNGLIFSTYLGGIGGSTGMGIAIDNAGTAYVTGNTNSSNFPTTGGAYRTTSTYGDIFVTAMGAAGNGLIYSTTIGSGQSTAIAVDPITHVAYLTGSTTSTQFPATAGAFQTTFGGVSDAFATALRADGSGLVYSTFLGGNGTDSGQRIALSGTSGQVVIAGTTAPPYNVSTNNFPVTAGAFQPVSTGGSDAFVTKVLANGTGLVYSSFLGGSGTDAASDLAVDLQGNAYVTGGTQTSNYNATGDFPVTAAAFEGFPTGAFVSKISPGGDSLVYSTWFAGSGCYYYGCYANHIAVDGSGRAYVAGQSSGTDLSATTDALQQTASGSDAFLAVLDPTGAYLTYATFLGGTSTDGATAIALDTTGAVYLAGATYSVDFPVLNAFQASLQSSQAHSFVAKIAMDATACFASTVTTTQNFPWTGGSGALAITAPAGCPWLVGKTTNYQAFLNITGTGAGTGNGAVSFVILRNFANSPRTQTLTVGTQSVNIIQAGAPCVETFTPASAPQFPGSGGEGSLAINIPSGCTWTLSSDSTWVVPGITGNNYNYGNTTGGTGTGTIRFVVAANNGPARTATFSVNGQTWTITQQTSRLLVSPSTLMVDSGASTGTISVSVNAASGPWTAFSMDSWIAITSGAAGSGAAAVQYSIAANNTGAQRITSMVIAGATVAVTQRATVQLFGDVLPSDYFFDAASLMRSRGITAGCVAAPLEYCPNASVTFAQIAVFIVRSVMGGDNFTYTQAPWFTDVSAANLYFPWIQKLRDLGFTSGCTVTTFCPDAPVSRAAAAGLLMRARLNGVTAYASNLPFTDVSNSDPNYTWIGLMRDQGISGGCTPTTFCPTATLTRGQIAVLLVRALFNQLLPNGAAMITSVTPNVLVRGQTVNVTISARNLALATVAAGFSAGVGITFGAAVDTTATSVTIPVTVASDATVGPRTIAAGAGYYYSNNPTGYGPNLLTIQ